MLLSVIKSHSTSLIGETLGDAEWIRLLIPCHCDTTENNALCVETAKRDAWHAGHLALAIGVEKKGKREKPKDRDGGDIGRAARIDD